MMSGEFASMSALYSVLSEITPRPIAWGTYASDPNVYFFLCAFHEMTDDVPDIQKLPSKIAELHRNGVSLNGKFGFPVPTFQGRLLQETEWTHSWEEFFSNAMKRMLALEEAAQGSDF